MTRRFPLIVLALVAIFGLVASACGGGGSNLKGAPSNDGEYAVKPESIAYDGERYVLLWEDGGGQYRELSGKGLQMMQDERTFLARQGGDVVLHLREDEPVQVLGRDGGGNYSSPWYPFLLGAVIGNSLSGPRYHYPPTDTFGRGDQLNGSVAQTKPQPPKYAGLPPNPNAVSAQNSGTGGGVAATNKASPSGPGNAVAPGVSGQAQGTGAGTAAASKGGFRAGESSYDQRISRTNSGSGSTGSQAQPSKSKPKAPSGGSRGGGGRGRGK